MRRQGVDGGGDQTPVAVELVHVDDGSFDAFYESEYRPLLRLAWGIEGRRDLAEEVVQDAMLSVHQRWDRVCDYDKPGAYARRVLLNMLVSRERRRRRERRAIARVGDQDAVHHDAEPPDQAFWTALRELPERQMQTVALHYLEGHSVRDIAGILDIAEGTVKTHLHRGRTALSDRLAEREDDQ